MTTHHAPDPAAPPNAEASPAGSSPRAAPERIAIVSGDRVCGSCGFNLHAQHVVREEHYNMLMVRCPECGQVASLHEYPVLGPWAKRVGFVLAAFWLLVMLAAVAATTGALVGGSVIASEAMLTGVTREISVAHARYADERLAQIDIQIASLQAQQDTSVRALSRQGLDAETTQAAPAQTPPNLAALTSQRQAWQWMAQQGNSPNSWVDESWWKANQGKADFARGFWRSIDWRTSFWMFVGAGLMPLTAGIFWAVTSPRWRGRAMLIAWVVLTLLGVGGVAFATLTRLMVDSMQIWNGVQMTQAGSLARELTGLASLVAALGVMSLLLLLAMRFGRAWARLAIRALLPPRMRTSFAYLWWCDGKDMPRTVRAPQVNPGG
ncbi:MAG: hypothetical protein JNL50_01710 [Phycisphaerae bacterium]|nr:hypothetical protein [Phycisphaerae bacterium]